MDVNYSLARKQVEIALAHAATNPAVRASHQGMADRYRAKVDAYRHRNGAIGLLAAPAPFGG